MGGAIPPPLLYDDMIYLLTAIGLTPGGIRTVHIYTQTIHRTTQSNRIHRAEHIKIHRHNNKNTQCLQGVHNGFNFCNLLGEMHGTICVIKHAPKCPK